MEETKERYVLFEFLEYFWKKKWIFVVLPLTLAIIAFGVTKLTEERPYTAQKTVYLGSDSKQYFSNKELVLNDYKKFVDENLRNGFDMNPTNNSVVFSLTNGSEEGLKGQIDNAVDNFFQDLVDAAEKTKSFKQAYIDELEEEKESNYNRLEFLNKKLDSENTNAVTINKILEEKYIVEELNLEYSNLVTMEKLELDNFEDPKALDTVVSQPDSKLTTNVAAAFIFGLFLSLLLVTLLKYIQDAKRGRRYD
ncbi:hypothetical protein [Bacillus sp. CHD6a]|uniref:hypothetical protein n=1 Tax=Bacillus sp. CHD6a TaxID=1643452 RepID=UPI0006CE209B|nr:hypothetical protein [Bacillus sp. CHD6a]KPB05666.1 hypothetical protein AAV98_05045 [Bacillus sp. CHD6a]